MTAYQDYYAAQLIYKHKCFKNVIEDRSINDHPLLVYQNVFSGFFFMIILDTPSGAIVELNSTSEM